MTRRYEIVYIFDSTLEEPQINEHLERFHGLLTTPENPEPIEHTNHWGKRTLAYPIKGREIGYYVVVQFAATSEVLGEFERLIKLEEAVLRYLMVINEFEVPAPPTEEEEAPASGETATAPADAAAKPSPDAPAAEPASDAAPPAEKTEEVSS